MSTLPGFAQFSPAIRKALTDNALRVSSVPAAQRLWERVFTAEQRRKLGGDFLTAYGADGTIGMWGKLHPVSEPRAIVEAAYALGVLNDPDRRWLIEGIGESAVHTVDKKIPKWDAATGKLYWGKRLIRKLRILKNPSNIQTLLNAFEEVGWPLRIPNPIRPQFAPPEQVHETLRSLNKDLKAIRFHSQEGGGAVCWSVG